MNNNNGCNNRCNTCSASVSSRSTSFTTIDRPFFGRCQNNNWGCGRNNDCNNGDNRSNHRNRSRCFLYRIPEPCSFCIGILYRIICAVTEQLRTKHLCFSMYFGIRIDKSA